MNEWDKRLIATTAALRPLAEQAREWADSPELQRGAGAAQETLRAHSALSELRQTLADPILLHLAEQAREWTNNPEVRYGIDAAQEALRAESALPDLRQVLADATATSAVLSVHYQSAEALLRQSSITELLPDLTQYRMPELAEIEHAMRWAATLALPAVLTATEAQGSIDSFLQQLDVPWVHAEAFESSLAQVLGLRDVGELLRSGTPFDVPVTDGLRHVLGDWSGVDQSVLDSLTDVASRAEFFIEHGANVDLIRIPLEVMDRGLVAAGIELDGDSGDGEQDSVDDLLEVPADPEIHLINDAQRQIVYLERMLRALIMDLLEREAGPKWLRLRVPEDIRTDWQSKQENARKSGRPETSLIEFSDFTHYEKILCRADNWNAAFAQVFDRKESLIESFRRLYPVRIAIMHSRSITAMDLMSMKCEVYRLTTAIRSFAKAHNKPYASR